ncbi:MAG: methyltransferase domain-containing protein [Stigonema ocellatum SAG 48.90 = DSM 106950]|nr:methyltransferase domain-containing protein [Stigonema ocellatum SAG 48.90 = DSM 106950]
MELDWEQRYQALNTPWDKGEPTPVLLEFLSNHPLSGKILVVGCGYGHDVRALAKHGGQVVGVDFAPSAIALAQSLPPIANETYLLADIFHLPKELHSSFDWVWEHTCFCAIDPQKRSHYVEAVAVALKPDGKLLAIFFLNPPNLENGPPYGVTVGELDQLFAKQFTLLREWQPKSAYPGREGREEMRLMQKN